MNQSKNILMLDKISKKDKSDSIKEVSDTLLLLQTNEKSEEVKVLKQIGLDSHIRAAEEAQRDIQRFTVLEEKFNRNVYSASQIKIYCKKFGYQILRVDKFKHEVPVIVGEKILEFVKENEYTAVRGEGREVVQSSIDLQVSKFFLLTSIQSVNGAPVKSATLFYRETYNPDNYHTIHENDMLIEVASWGIPGNENSMFWQYAKATDYFLLAPFVFLFIGILIQLFSDSSHGMMLFLMTISICSIVLISKPSFFKWNLK